MKKLKKYQKRIVRELIKNPYYALFVGMGLGKTRAVLTALSRIERKATQKTLIVGPIQVVESTWPSEIEKWEFPFTYSLLRGKPAERKAALESDADIYGINFEMLPWLSTQKKSLKKFDILVIDELTNAKSTKSFAYRFFKYKRPQFSRIIGMTGTIVPESYVDLYGQMTSIVKLWENKITFIDKHFTDESRNPKYTKYELKNKKAKKKIEKKIAPYILTLSSDDYLEVPPFVYNDIWMELPNEQRKKYDELENELFLELDSGELDSDEIDFDENVGISTKTVSSTRIKLRQILSGFLYTEDSKTLVFDDHKLKIAKSTIQSIDENLLVMYYFKEERIQLQKHTKAVLLKGPHVIDQWNRGELPLLVGHPRSMGHGLNIQAGGHNILWYSMPWSMEQYHQSNARLRRTGQENYVVIHRLLYRNTIDEAIIDAQANKYQNHESLINALKAYRNRRH